MNRNQRWLAMVSQMVMAGLAGMVCGQWMAAWIWAGAWLLGGGGMTHAYWEKERVLRVLDGVIMDATAPDCSGTCDPVISEAMAKLRQAINEIPLAAAEPVIYAHWERMPQTIKGHAIYMYTGCTNCRREAEVLQAGGGAEFTSLRCPYCGAHMLGVSE